MEKSPLYIREAKENDLDDVLLVESQAFGHNEEAELVKQLLNDSSAEPTLSLLAFDGEQAVGHILFTSAHLTKTKNTSSIVILAPLAVIPVAQNQGIGGQLIKQGLELLSKTNTELVFVLGHPGYYPRYGFEASYPIPDINANAWMVQALQPGIIGTISGKVVCAHALDKPEYWRE